MNLNYHKKIKTRTLEEYNLVMKIRKERKAHGIIKISRLTSISPHTINGWLYRGVKPKRLRKTKILPNEARTLSPELAYILGVIEGDGCICKARRRSIPGENYDYTLTLSVTDKDFADYFSEQLEKWSSFKSYRTIRPPRGEGKLNQYYVRLRSKDIYEFLYNFDLDTLLDMNDKIKGMFLKGFYDSDGSVSRDIKGRSVVIGVINLEVMLLARKLLESLGIHCGPLKERIKEGFQNFYYFYISSTKALKLFRDKVGFSIARKQERLTNLLDNLPTSEEISKRRAKYAENKKHLYDFICKNPGLRPCEISKIINWDIKKVNNYLDRMLKRKLIRKTLAINNLQNKKLIYATSNNSAIK